MQIARDPLEIAIDSLCADDLVNLIDCGNASLPECFGRVAPKNLNEMMQAFVRNISQMRGGMSRIGRRATLAVQ